jgi:uncharacterized phage-associated protein
MYSFSSLKGGVNMREATFSPQKAVEMLVYISKKIDHPTIHQVLKIQYFADKIHVRDFGFMASGDEYVAMEFGPVGTSTYNIIKAARGQADNYTKRFKAFVEGAILVERESVTCMREPNTEYLSESHLHCIDEAIAEYGRLDFKTRTDASHDEAWTNAWKAAKESKRRQSPISQDAIINTLPNAQEILEHVNA